MAYRYVPLLRSKAGEATALGHLTNQAKARLLPVMHVPETPPATFARRTVAAWANLPLAMDGLFNLNATGTPNGYIGMFDELGQGNVAVMPSTECNAPAAYIAAINPLVGKYTPGLVVKATLPQLPQAAGWVAAQGWNSNEIDLIVEAGEVGSHDPVQFAAYLVQILTNTITQPQIWRSITLASSAAPRHLGGLPVGRTDIPRADWQVWQLVDPQVPFELDYGDYAHLHPNLTEPPGIAMARAPVSVRYSADDDWIILKGRPITGPNAIQMGPQYLGHANALVSDPQFGNVPGCWGDQRIQGIANGGVSTGNRPSWATVLINRHLSLVADRLP